MAEMIQQIEPGLTAERVENGVKYTKTMPDGTQHSTTLYVFSKELIDELRAAIPAAQERGRVANHRKTWWGRMRLRAERLLRKG